jgi:hypothetical protein
MNDQEVKPARKWVQFLTLSTGVILPIISITIEASTHICAQEFFDPIPTTWHLLLVVFVPLAQLHVWFKIHRGVGYFPVLAFLVNGIAVGISIFYSIVYLPLAPLGAMLLIVGLGALPLTPFFSLLAAVVMNVQLKNLASRESSAHGFWIKGGGLVLGVAITAAAIVLIELPASLTRYGMRMAASASPATRAEGIGFLQSWGSREFLLRACYQRTGWATDLGGYIMGLSDPLTTSEAQKIYYRVTGETFDTSSPPERIGGRVVPPDTIDRDQDQGGTKVGLKLRGLSLSNSRLDARAYGNGGVAYTEWLLTFQNDSDQQREARAEVQLPPGGVVSRLTLWVNGEEREAAFGGRSQVKEAYQRVAITQRRDPVLVTTAGRDRILVQCFPVQPHDQMKIRLGITAPLLLDNDAIARFVFPHFVKRNFRIPNDVQHVYWIESETAISSSMNATVSDWLANGSAMNGRIHDFELSKPESSIMVARGNVQKIWSKDPFGTPGFVIQQSIQERNPTHLNRIVLVVDTSAAIRPSMLEIVEGLKQLGEDVDLNLVLTNVEQMDDVAPGRAISGGSLAGLALTQTKFVGGADNVPALLHAWDLAAAKPGNNAIVWVHSPQLLELRPVEELRQRWERRPYGPTLYSVRTTAGADVIEGKLESLAGVRSVPRVGPLHSDLQTLFGRLRGELKTLEFVRTSKKADPAVALLDSVETSDHLARLWANDEVGRILAAGDQELNNAATMLAVHYQLVTPVSGAVVLETAEQYRAAGLQPVDAGTVPTIPEPEMVILVAIAGLFLAWLLYRKRALRGGCPI